MTEQGGFPIQPPPRVLAVDTDHGLLVCCPLCGHSAHPFRFLTPDRTCRGCGRMLRDAEEIVEA